MRVYLELIRGVVDEDQGDKLRVTNAAGEVKQFDIPI